MVSSSRFERSESPAANKLKLEGSCYRRVILLLLLYRNSNPTEIGIIVEFDLPTSLSNTRWNRASMIVLNPLSGTEIPAPALIPKFVCVGQPSQRWL